MSTHTVSTLKTNSQTYTYDQLQQLVASGALDKNSVKNVSVFTQSADPSACTDGKDDGKVGFFEGLGSVIKGAAKGLVNGVKGMFLDENGKFSLKNTLKTVAIGAACMIPGVGPVIAGGLCAYGVVKGGVGIAKGVSAAANAKTDAEAKAALESVGGNALTTGLSVVGLKGSISAISRQAAGLEGGSSFASAKGIKGKAAGLVDDIVKVNKNYYGEAWAKGMSNAGTGTLSKVYNVGKELVKTGAEGTAENVINTAKAAKEFAQDKADRALGKKGTVDSPKDMAKKLSTKDTKITEGQIKKALKNGGEIKVGDKTYKVTKTGTGKETTYSFEQQSAKSTTTTYDKVQGEFGKINKSQLKEEGLTTEQITKVKNGEQVTIGDKTYQKTGNRYEVAEAVPQKTTTTTNTFDAMKNTSVKIQNPDGTISTVKLGDKLTTSTPVTAADGTVYSLDKGIVTKTSTSNISKFQFDAHQYIDNAQWNAMDKGFAGTAGLTEFTMAAGRTDYDSQIQNASMTYATVDTQTGREYELEDYQIYNV